MAAEQDERPVGPNPLRSTRPAVLATPAMSEAPASGALLLPPDKSRLPSRHTTVGPERAPHRFENGPRFYGLPLNPGFVALGRTSWCVWESLAAAGSELVPFQAGARLDWKFVGPVAAEGR